MWKCSTCKCKSDKWKHFACCADYRTECPLFAAKKLWKNQNSWATLAEHNLHFRSMTQGLALNSSFSFVIEENHIRSAGGRRPQDEKHWENSAENEGKENQARTGVNDENVSIECVLCIRSFVTFRALHRHNLQHHSDSKFTCPMCKKCFKTKSSLQQHQKCVHIEEFNYMCNICGHLFKAAGTLAQHVKSHSFFCHHCKKAFVMQEDLTAHKSHCFQKKFQCSLCDLKFSRKRDVDRHVSVVHFPVYTYCVICEKSTKQSKAEHLRKKHPEVLCCLRLWCFDIVYEKLLILLVCVCIISFSTFKCALYVPKSYLIYII